MANESWRPERKLEDLDLPGVEAELERIHGLSGKPGFTGSLSRIENVTHTDDPTIPAVRSKSEYNSFIDYGLDLQQRRIDLITDRKRREAEAIAALDKPSSGRTIP